MSDTDPSVKNDDRKPRYSLLGAVVEFVIATAIGVLASLAASLIPVLATKFTPTRATEGWWARQGTEYSPVLLVIVSISIGLASAYILAKRRHSIRESRENLLRAAVSEKETAFLQAMDEGFAEIIQERV